MYSISKVTAVNRLLQAVDGTIISTLDTEPQRGSVIKAVQAIDITTDDVQSNNRWGFSLEGPKTITADDDGIMTLPSDYMHITWTGWSNGAVGNLTTKAGKVYDRRQSTFVLQGNASFYGNVRWEFEDCPYPIQNLIIQKAKFDFFNTAAHLSPSRAAMTSPPYKDAFTAALKWDSEMNGGILSQLGDIRGGVIGGNFWEGNV